jgi:hypothetical protein
MSYIQSIPTPGDLLTRAKLSRDLIPDFDAANLHPSPHEAAKRNRKVCADALNIALDDWQFFHHSAASLSARDMDRAVSELVGWCWTEVEDREADRIVGPADVLAMRNDYRRAMAAQ